jgi:hypothetical protein
MTLILNRLKDKFFHFGFIDDFFQEEDFKDARIFIWVLFIGSSLANWSFLKGNLKEGNPNPQEYQFFSFPSSAVEKQNELGGAPNKSHDPGTRSGKVVLIPILIPVLFPRTPIP